jgi:hypothetical protein
LEERAIHVRQDERRLIHYDRYGCLGENMHHDCERTNYKEVEEAPDHEASQERNDNSHDRISNMRDAISKYVPEFEPQMFNLIHCNSPARGLTRN